jgi:hypothetical protein
LHHFRNELCNNSGRQLRLFQKSDNLGVERHRTHAAKLALLAGETGILQRGQRIRMALGGADWIASDSHRLCRRVQWIAGQGSLRRWDTVYATLRANPT